MPHPIDDDTAAALDAIRREALAVKIDAAPEPGERPGPLYRLATQIGLLTDLVEYLLLREHTHSGAQREPQRFGG